MSALCERERAAVRVWLMDRVASSLDDLVQRGGRYACECADGFTMSVVAHWGGYCIPRPDRSVPWDFNGPYVAVEVGYPSQCPEPWDSTLQHTGWEGYAETVDDPCGTVYACVPVEMVAALIESHGGAQ